MRLANEVIHMQTTREPLAQLYTAFYECRELLVRSAFRDYGNDTLPMISLEPDDGSWRGKFQTVGPFGFPNVITINVRRFKLASDAAETFAHEMAHWFVSGIADVDDDDLHGVAWQTVMTQRLGLPPNDQSTEQWWELEAQMSQHLGRFVLSR